MCLGSQIPSVPPTCMNGYASGIANKNYTVEVDNVCGNNSSNNSDNNKANNNGNNSNYNITSGRRKRKATTYFGKLVCVFV